MEPADRRRLIRSAAVAIGVVAFGFRLTLVRDLSNDHYMHLAWAQQVLFGELPGRDFVDPGMPLMYTLSAIVQWIWPGPFSEGALSCVLMALAAVATFVVATDLTGSVILGIAATLFEIALEPRLYSYPKILVPAVALLLIQQYVRRPDRRRVIYLALWTAVAVLLRHDLGLYAAAGIASALVVAHAADWKRMARALSEYAAAVVAAMLPYVIFIQWTEGIGEHLHEALEFAKGEAHQRFLAPPAFPFWSAAGGLASWSRMDCAVFLFYAANLLAVVTLVLLVRTREPRSGRTTVATGGLAMLLMYLAIVLRHPIDSRIPDVGALVAIMGAWVLAETASRVASAARTGWNGAAIASVSMFLLAATGAIAGTASMWMLGDVGNRIKATRVVEGFGTVERSVESVKETGTVWPWERFWPAGELPPAVRYLNACTTQDDAVLLTWAAPEYYFFARRRFGAGHALFLPPDAFTTPHDQERMLERIRHDRIPIVLINESRNEEFAKAYPDVERYLRAQYVPAGHFDIRDGSHITIAIDRDLQGSRTYESEGWPCGFDKRAASKTASTMLDGSAIPLPAMSNAVP